MDTSRDAISTWCREYLADLLEVPVDAVAPDADFDRLGVDSALAVSLLIDIEDRYGVDLSPESLFESPRLDAVVDMLHARLRQPVA
ncbi:acyl carrier protein [Pseudonocardia sediminis]|uniref:Acyl carrier protein n=1 Tax=Pseudonocardia sediminis TaxID=1397368 RepID=A0A4Q7V088_PSEST|nr:acyl carrier protein [Pseudonocardia sediminis]RZT86834.1 acyl carrier protein [Pseudonocardia sediminis]